MERLLVTSGGRPLKLEDLVLNMQVTTMLESLISKLGQEIIIVSGCDISTGGVTYSYNVTAGIIWYNGKFWAFDALTDYVVGPFSFTINLITSVVEDTPRTHFDGVVRDTIETSKLVYTAGTPEVVFNNNTPRLEDWLTKGAGLTTKVIEIGDWNMSVVPGKNVSHGLSSTEWKTIKSASVIIRNDDDDAYYTLFGGEGKGYVNFINSSLITLNTGGTYDGDLDFDSTSHNRGWVTIQYIAD